MCVLTDISCQISDLFESSWIVITEQINSTVVCIELSHLHPQLWVKYYNYCLSTGML